MKKLMIFSATTTLLLAGCGGDYESDSLNGSLNTRTCTDFNSNSRCDQGELDAPENAGLQQLNAGTEYARLSETVDSVSGAQHHVMKAPAGYDDRIDALTTLLWYESRYNPEMNGDLAETQNHLNRTFGIVWPAAGSEPEDAYQQQESAAREQLLQAQTIYPIEIAIAATAESMAAHGSLDAAPDERFVRSLNGLVSTDAQVVSAGGFTTWDYHPSRAELATVTNGNVISIYGFDINSQFFSKTSGRLSPGQEQKAAVAANAASGQPLIKSLATTENNFSGRIDAFAGATTATPAPAPAPPPPPAPGGGSNPGEPAPDNGSRQLNPAGDISEIRLADDFRSGFALTTESNANETAPRACNTSIATHGIFRFDGYISNDSMPVKGGCNSYSIQDFELSADGRNMLAYDQVAQRIYWVSSEQLTETSAYYLQLSNNLRMMRLNNSGDYFALLEQQDDRAHIIRVSDMQAMTFMRFANQEPVEDVQWLDNGAQMLIASASEWQRWDTRLPYKPALISQGTLEGSGNVSLSDSGEYYARSAEGNISVYAFNDNREVTRIQDVDRIQWNGGQIIAEQGDAIRQYTLHRQINSELQIANLLLTPAFIAGGNSSMTDITAPLNLPVILPGTNLEIIWSGTLNSIEYTNENNNQGNITRTQDQQRGTVTATINGSFRGNAVRWTRDYPVSVKSL